METLGYYITSYIDYVHCVVDPRAIVHRSLIIVEPSCARGLCYSLHNRALYLLLAV